MTMRSLLLAGLVAMVPMSFAEAEDLAGGAIKTAMVGKTEIFTDAKGMTLYTFDKDGDGASACYDDCAKKWPPLMAAKGAKAHGELSLVKRKDGSMQWAHEGKPLYLWVKDTKPGETTGDGVGGVWHTAED